MPPEPIPYSKAVRLVENGDMVAVEREGDISMVGRGKYSHIGQIAFRPSDIGGWSDSVAESMEGIGGRITSLAKMVNDNPGRIWIYKPLVAKHIRERAATIAYEWCIQNHHYDYRGIMKVLLLHTVIPLKIARIFGFAPNPNDEIIEPWASDKFCSELYDWSYIRAIEHCKFDTDWRPIYDINPQYVEPSDLPRSGSFRLRFNGPIIPDPVEAQT